MKKEFTEWLNKQDLKSLNDSYTEKIFQSFIKEYTDKHFNEIAIIINNVERARIGKKPHSQSPV